MGEYSCTVELIIDGNNHEAKSVEEYKKKVIQQYAEEYGITLAEEEIKDIQKEDDVTYAGGDIPGGDIPGGDIEPKYTASGEINPFYEEEDNVTRFRMGHV